MKKKITEINTHNKQSPRANRWVLVELMYCTLVVISALHDGQVNVLGLGPIGRVPTRTGITVGCCWCCCCCSSIPPGCRGGYRGAVGGACGKSVYGGGMPCPLAENKKIYIMKVN